MRDFSFNVQIAAAYGVDEAVFIHAMEFWIKKNCANERHFHDGRWWSYNSLAAYCDIFPFWTKRQLERIIASCQKKGLLYIGNYSEDQWRRTTWYALDDCIFEIYGDFDCISPNGEMHFTKSESSGTKAGNALPETGKCTQIKTPVTKPAVAPPIVPPEGERLWTSFWNAYPRKVNTPAAKRAWDKLAVDDALLSDMLSALEAQKRSRDWTRDGGRFIPYPATWLNGRRWEDEDIGPGTSASAGGRASEREVLPEWT